MLQRTFQNYQEPLTSVVVMIACSVFLLASLAIAEEERSWRLLPDVHKSTIWRVQSNGAISKIAYPFYDSKANSGIFAQSYPLPSPDQRKIAHIKSNDLWVYDIEKNADQRVTNIGQPEDKEFASIFVATITWSSDSKNILYRVLSGSTEPQGGDGPNWTKEKRGAEFGVRVVDIDTRASNSIEIQGISEPVWLPNGKFLVVAEGASVGKLDDELHLFEPNRNESRLVTQERAWYSRPVISLDGRWALTSAGQGVGPDLISPGKDLRSQIKKINLQTGDVINVTKLGRWGEFYSYALSPSGNGVAYSWKKSSNPNEWRVSVVVDGRELYFNDGIASIYWINETTIAINSRSELVILDARSGKTIGAQRH